MNMTDRPFMTVILAAGKGTRMASDLAKVLHPMRGRPLLDHCVAVARATGDGDIVIIVGYQAAAVRAAFRDPALIFVEQRDQLGTGHAILQARETFRNFSGTVLILCGDVPLLRSRTVQSLLAFHREQEAVVTVMSTILDDPASYGRIVKNAGGEVLKIVEAKDASLEEKKVREINTGIYCAEGPFLYEAVGEITNDNAQKEYYLTDIVAIARKKGCRVRSFVTADTLEVMGINTPVDLALAEAESLRRLQEGGS